MNYNNLEANKGGVGNIYYVMQTGQSSIRQNFLDTYQKYYQDGTQAVQSDIQTALDATVADRNDYVLVMPDGDDYDLTTGLTMTKKAVHLIAPSGLGWSVGAPNATRIDGSLGSGITCLTLTGHATEVAGFFFKGDVDSDVIALGTATAAYCVWVHHNAVGITATSGSATKFGITTGAGNCNFSLVEFNRVWAYQAVNSSVNWGGFIKVNGLENIIRGNFCNTRALTVATGISVGGDSGNLVLENILVENISYSSYSAGTLTLGISTSTIDQVIGNKISITTSANAVSGGTASESYILNYCGISNATAVGVVD